MRHAVPWALASAAAVLVAAPLLAVQADPRERWSVDLSSTESSLLNSPPCPAVMPSVPSSLNIHLSNLTEGDATASALKFLIGVGGKTSFTANHPDLAKQAFRLGPHASQSIGIGFSELEFRDTRGRSVPRAEILKLLAQSKWSMSAVILDNSVPAGVGVYSSNILEFPLSREACERGISCSR